MGWHSLPQLLRFTACTQLAHLDWCVDTGPDADWLEGQCGSRGHEVCISDCNSSNDSNKDSSSSPNMWWHLPEAVVHSVAWYCEDNLDSTEHTVQLRGMLPHASALCDAAADFYKRQLWHHQEQLSAVQAEMQQLSSTEVPASSAAAASAGAESDSRRQELSASIAAEQKHIHKLQEQQMKLLDETVAILRFAAQHV